MSRDIFSYTHGDTGNKPSSSLNFQSNQRPDAQHFDWWWYQVIQAINGHADEFTRLDSNDDGIVDEADYAPSAGDADTLDGYHYGDIQSWVENTAKASNADKVDGKHASELGGGSGPSCDGYQLGDGKAHPIDRFPSLPTGTTLDVTGYRIANESFASPSGLSIIVYDHTNNTELARYTNASAQGLTDSLDIGGIDVAIYVDNGDTTFGYTSSGSKQKVTVSMDASVQ